jgi:hypothetical protein
MPTKKGLGRVSACSGNIGHTARRWCRQAECNNGEDEKGGRENERPHEQRRNSARGGGGLEGVHVCKAEAFRQIGGILEKLLHGTPCEHATMEATIMKAGYAR